MDAIPKGADTRTRLGMITPSSNTVLEPVCSEMLRGLSAVTAHFTRVRVTHISLDRSSSTQFDLDAMQNAAFLLADAKVGSVCWNGTSASWLGFEHDEALCAAIRQRTGVPATSASLATVELFRRAGVARFGLVTPYTDDVQEQIIANYVGLGVECVAETHAGLTDNFAFSDIDDRVLARMVRQVAQARPQAISILCTNLRGAPLAAALEKETGVAIYDSTACAVWGALRLAGVDTRQVNGWGSLFAL